MGKRQRKRGLTRAIVACDTPCTVRGTWAHALGNALDDVVNLLCDDIVLKRRCIGEVALQMNSTYVSLDRPEQAGERSLVRHTRPRLHRSPGGNPAREIAAFAPAARLLIRHRRNIRL